MSASSMITNSRKEATMDKKVKAHITMILSWVLGYLGADRFYLGQAGWSVEISYTGSMVVD